MTSISAQRAGCGANLRQRSIQPRFSEGAGCVQFPHRPGRSATRTEPWCSGGMPNILVVQCFEDNGSARADTMSRKRRRRYARTEPIEAARPGYLMIRLLRLGLLVQAAATELTPRNSRLFGHRSCGGNREQNPIRFALHTGDRDAAPDPSTQCTNRNSDRDGEIVHRVR